MKRVVLTLALAAFVAACGTGVTGPDPSPDLAPLMSMEPAKLVDDDPVKRINPVCAKGSPAHEKIIEHAPEAYFRLCFGGIGK